MFISTSTLTVLQSIVGVEREKELGISGALIHIAKVGGDTPNKLFLNPVLDLK